MGIARPAIALLLEEAAVRPFSGKIVTLGRQTIGASADEIKAEFQRFKVAPLGALTATPDDNELFQMMGFVGVESLDYSDFENATHIVDLNHDGLPAQLIGQFDVVLDGGTLEHVFHLPNALKNALSLLKEGGRAIFISPSTNYVDHGFYMFSPTLFWDYLLVNGFSIETSYFIRCSLNTRKRWRAYAYERDSYRRFSIGSLDSAAIHQLCGRNKKRGRYNRENTSTDFLFGQLGRKDWTIGTTKICTLGTYLGSYSGRTRTRGPDVADDRSPWAVGAKIRE